MMNEISAGTTNAKGLVKGIVFFSTLIWVAISFAQSEVPEEKHDPGRAFEHIDAFFTQLVEGPITPGVSLAITDRDKLLYIGTYGYADIESKKPLNPDVMFEIGSTGKTFVATLAMQLVEAGVLELQQPFQQYLPWFKVQSDFEPMTVHHVLSHTGGLVRNAGGSGQPLATTWDLRKTHTGFPPGEKWSYSNAGYTALSVMLESVAGKPYGQLLQQKILDPLGMTQTHPLTTNDTREHLATGYTGLFYDDRPFSFDHPVERAPWEENLGGAGSLSSTPADLSRFLRMLMNSGKGPDGSIISENSFSLMSQPVAEAYAGINYGYGLMTYKGGGFDLIFHNGGTLGHNTVMVADLESGFGVVAMTNGSSVSGWGTYLISVLRASLAGETLPEAPPEQDLTRVENAAEYAGVYTGESGALTLVARDTGLFLLHKGEHIALEMRGADAFFAPHPDFKFFHLEFGRDDGKVVEVFYGPQWYRSDLYQGPVDFDVPELWNAYIGDYRSKTPWVRMIRIYPRKGGLLLAYPSSPSGELLIPLGENEFQVGREGSPPRLRFDPIVAGQAIRTTFFAIDFYRTNSSAFDSLKGSR